jgi:O-acetyl-ADP-ribose deacetylase (regulator of RNase III)
MRKIEVFCGSITDCPTMCVVNTSNTSIGLGSGVSSAIRQACGGVAFQQECREALEEFEGGVLPQGEVAVTTGGTSQYRWVFHAATMDFKKSKKATFNVVRSCMLNSLKAAERVIEDEGLDDFTIGVPLFGSDTGGLSFEDSCNAICEAMKAHFKNNRDSLISQILIVNKKPEVCSNVKLILASHFVLR